MVEPSTAPRLFGREREAALWQEAAGRVAAGEGRTVVFAGRAGIGKTALVEHVVGDADARGWRTLRAAASPLHATLPGTVLWQWFAALVRATPPGAAPFDGPGEQVRGQVLRTHENLDAAGLAFASAWVLRSLTEDGPLVCVLDDAQWADDLSQGVLALLPQLVADEPVAFVLGVRDDPATPVPAAVRGVVDRAGSGLATLTALRHADVAGWVHATLGEAATDVRETVSRIQIATAGVPYFVRELVASLDAAPAGTDRGATLGGSSGQAMLLERVAALEERDRSVLQSVVLLGEQAVDEHLSALSGVDADGLAAAYAALREQRLIATTYPPRASHSLVADAALAGLDPAETSARRRDVATLLRRDRRRPGRRRGAPAAHPARRRPRGRARPARGRAAGAAPGLPGHRGPPVRACPRAAGPAGRAARRAGGAHRAGPPGGRSDRGRADVVAFRPRVPPGPRTCAPPARRR